MTFGAHAIWVAFVLCVGLIPWACRVADDRDQHFPNRVVILRWRMVVLGVSIIVVAGMGYARFGDGGLSAEAFGSLLAAAFVLFGTKYAADNLSMLSVAHAAEYSSKLRLSVSSRLQNGRRILQVRVTNAGRSAAVDVRVIRWQRDSEEFWVPYRLTGFNDVLQPNRHESSDSDYDGELKLAFLFARRPVYEVTESLDGGGLLQQFYDVGMVDGLGFAPVSISKERPSFEPKRQAIIGAIVALCKEKGVIQPPQDIDVLVSGNALSVVAATPSGVLATGGNGDLASTVEWISTGMTRNIVRSSNTKMIADEP